MPNVHRLRRWIETASTARIIYAKRLSGNDTLANHTHQGGPYVAKPAAFEISPSVNTTKKQNPKSWFSLTIVSHDMPQRTVVLTYYNRQRTLASADKGKGKGKKESRVDELRITRLGGRSSPLLDPDSTGALAIFAFFGSEPELRSEVWVCRDADEEDVAEEWLGIVDPGYTVLSHPDSGVSVLPEKEGKCRLSPDELPPDWRDTYPSGEEIVAKTLEILPTKTGDADKRLLRRRQCEFEIFESIQDAIELPRVKAGFDGLEPFLQCAMSIVNRRKSRGGRSLELQVRQILLENGFVQGEHFDHDVISEGSSRPDFVFPSRAAYQNPRYPESNLRMLAVKTTCRDRWRQILTEAHRISCKHLLTLQRGVSENQFQQIQEARVCLVVPKKLHERYRRSMRPHLLTLEGFLKSLGSLLKVPAR